MALGIYEFVDPDKAFSVSGEFTNALPVTFDGTLGGVIKRRYFVRNDDTNHTYSGIFLEPIELSSGMSIIDGTDNFSWKLKAGDDEPLEEEWALITPASGVNIPNILTTHIYEPFWLRMEVPRGAPVRPFEDVKLKITSKEVLV